MRHIWVKGSRRYKNFDDYLIPGKDFDKLTPALPLPVSADYHEYITSRMTLLQSKLEDVNAMAARGKLPVQCDIRPGVDGDIHLVAHYLDLVAGCLSSADGEID